MKRILITNANIVNEGNIYPSDIYVENGTIARIDKDLSGLATDQVIDAGGKFLLPGVIDDQVHFREPGLTHKANIYTESKAAVAGGITTFMEMPNTVPNTLTQELLEEKYAIAANTSLANFSFFMGASNDNLQEVLKTDPRKVCGIKVFMGSSTGNMLIDNPKTLENLFTNANMLIAAHCEDEATIKANVERYKAEYPENAPPYVHCEIRNEEACYKSSSMAVALAKKHNTRFHVLHISTEEEIKLFDDPRPLGQKRITAEVCVHHLWFEKSDYERLGNKIKWNPAVKEGRHKRALLEALLAGKLDIVATDHAPHTVEEKSDTYWKAPSGGPLVQHSLVAMLDLYQQGKISIDKVAEKMAHNPAKCFDVSKRGFIREGYFADLVLVDVNAPWTVSKENILYKCGWSPFEGHTFKSRVTHTFVNGRLVYEHGKFNEEVKGQRLTFDR